MNLTLSRTDITGSQIAFFSSLVKQYGGYNFAQGIPGFSPPQQLLNELKGIVDKDIHQYPPGNGNLVLIKEIIRLYQYQAKLSTEQVTVVQGATEGIHLAYQFIRQYFSRSINCLAFDPVYESYLHLPVIYQDRLFKIPFQEKGAINWDALRDLLLRQTIDLVFVNSPGNPYGKVWSEKELSKIISLSKEFGFFIVFDGVYLRNYFGSEKPANPLDADNERLIYINSFSKMLSITGWRVGYVVASTKNTAKMRDIHDYTGLCAVSVMQEAIARYLQKHQLEDYLAESRKKLYHGATLLSEVLTRHGFRMDIPQAGYFIWAALPSRYPDGIDFCLDLYKQKKVAMVPGIHFTEKGESFVRINYARESEDLIPGIEALESYLKA